MFKEIKIFTQPIHLVGSWPLQFLFKAVRDFLQRIPSTSPTAALHLVQLVGLWPGTWNWGVSIWES